jgi:RNA polymerase sigma-32 factor
MAQHYENHHYVQKIKKIPLLENDEEYVLAKQWRDHNDAKAIEKLISSHLRLVLKVANGYRGYGLPLSDLIAEGNLGMMQAIKHYDPEKGFRFATYASWWIRANINEYILQSWSLVKMGTTSAQKKLFFSLRRTEQALEAEEESKHLEHGLTREKAKKIANKLDVSEEEVFLMHQRLSGRDHSLNAPLGSDDQDSEWIEWIADDKQNQELSIVENDEMEKRKKLFEQALSCLNEREHLILKSRRLMEPPKTLEELSSSVGISRERVRQIENKAFEKLQKNVKKISQTRFHNI